MADRVQFIMDRMTPTFNLFNKLEIFSQDEVKSIVKKRTDFEYVLRRRELKPADFYTYLHYETTLEKFRKIRCQPTKGVADNKDMKDGKRNLQKASLRHICYIFDRAVRRFPGDVGLWMDYIAFLKENNAMSILNTVFGRALSLYPDHEEFWIQAAQHELDNNNNAHAARALYQTSLRGSNVKSDVLWLKYFQLEIWQALRVRERRKILIDRGAVDYSTAVVEDTTHTNLLLGAPVIVFKHCIGARQSVALSCSMLKLCLSLNSSHAGDVGELITELRSLLINAFPGSADVGKHLVEVSICSIGGRASGQAGSKKRKGGEKAVHGTDKVDIVSEMLESTVSILSSGLSLAGGTEIDPTEDEAVVRSRGKDYIHMSEKSVVTVLQECMRILNNVSLNRDSSLTCKRQRQLKDTKREPSDDNGYLAAACSDLHDRLQSVSSFLDSLLVYEGAGACSSVKSAYQMMGRHVVHQLRSTIGTDVVHADGLATLVNWLTTDVSLQDTDSRLREDWCEVAQLACSTALKLSLLPVASNSTTDDVLLAQQENIETVIHSLLTLLLSSKSAVVTKLLSFDRGNEILSSVVDLYYSLTCGDNSAYANISLPSFYQHTVVSASTEDAWRPVWCKRYLQHCLLYAMEDESESAMLATSYVKPLISWFYWLRTAMRNVPQNWSSPSVKHSMSDVYVEVLHSLLSLHTVSPSMGQTVQDVVDHAIGAFGDEDGPAATALWESWEAWERLQGNHKKANHIRWKFSPKL